MGWCLIAVLAYLLVLAGFNFYRARQVKSQEDFMVAGRKLSLTVMVFTLICTWIGSGTFIAGAEYAARAGWSSLWLPAGAWFGIAVIYFLAAKIRNFGQYTIGDILEVRYGKFARLFGAIALITSFTVIVSYQFRAGGLILNMATDGRISVAWGQFAAALFVIGFTALGGMIAVAHTDLPNGIIILLACCLALPLVMVLVGGPGAPAAALPAQHFALFSADFGDRPALQAGGTFLATLLLLMGVQSMYQKFYSAKSPREARRAVALWVVGTVAVETLVVAIAIYSASAHWAEIKAFDIADRVKQEVAAGAVQPGGALDRAIELARALEEKGNLKPGQVMPLHARLTEAFSGVSSAAKVADVRVGIDPASIVLQAARDLIGYSWATVLVGILLLGAACAVVISTGMNYLLSPTTNIMRDIYQRFVWPDADQKRMVALQKVFVCLLGLCAFLLIWYPTVRKLRISVLSYAIFAYTIYGVSITPALLAALAWRRATRAGGVVSIVLGAVVTLGLKIGFGDAPWGVPIIYPAAAASIGSLIVVSLLTRKPTDAELSPLFGAKSGAGAASQGSATS